MCNCCGNCGYVKEMVYGLYCYLQEEYTEADSVCLSHRYKQRKEDKNE